MKNSYQLFYTCLFMLITQIFIYVQHDIKIGMATACTNSMSAYGAITYLSYQQLVEQAIGQIETEAVYLASIRNNWGSANSEKIHSSSFNNPFGIETKAIYLASIRNNWGSANSEKVS